MDRTRFNRPPRTRSCIARAPSDPSHAPGDWDRLQARFNPLHADLKPFPSGGGRGAGELQGDLKSVEAGLKRAKRTAPRGIGGIDAKERDTSREYPFSRLLVIGRRVVGGHDAGREGREGRKGREGETCLQSLSSRSSLSSLSSSSTTQSDPSGRRRVVEGHDAGREEGRLKIPGFPLRFHAPGTKRGRAASRRRRQAGGTGKSRGADGEVCRPGTEVRRQDVVGSGLRPNTEGRRSRRGHKDCGMGRFARGETGA